MGEIQVYFQDSIDLLVNGGHLLLMLFSGHLDLIVLSADHIVAFLNLADEVVHFGF